MLRNRTITLQSVPSIVEKETKSGTPHTACTNNTGKYFSSKTPTAKNTPQAMEKYITKRLHASKSPRPDTRSRSRQCTPGKICKNTGRQRCLTIFDELHNSGTQKNLRLVELQMRFSQQQRNKLQQKPNVGQASKQIFDEMKQRKKLSSKTLQRFNQYEQNKVQERLDNIISTYWQETHSIPSLKELLRTCKDELVSLLRHSNNGNKI